MVKVRAGQIWKKSDHERISVDEVSGQTVSGTLSDTRAGTVAVWVGTPGDFESLELLADAS